MRRGLATVLVGAALLLAACGGDDDAGSTDGSPTREEYIARADAFCKQANAKAKGLNERIREAARAASPGRDQLRAIAPILEEGYGLQRRARDEFKEIPYPPADRAIVEKLHAAFDEQTALVGRLLDASKAGDVARARALTEEQNRLKLQTRGMAQGYGFEECGSGRNEAG